MLSIPLVRQELLQNIRMWLIITALMAAGTAVGIAGCIPGENGSVPAGGELYECIFRLVPLIFIIAAAARQVAGSMDDGMMSYLLSTPNGRKKIMFSKVYVLAASLFFMFAVLFFAGLIANMVFGHGGFDMALFLWMNFGCFCLHLGFAGICFLISCTVRRKASCLLACTVVVSVSFLFWVLSNMGGFLGYFRYVSVFSMLSVTSIQKNSLLCAAAYLALLILGAVCFWLGCRIFERRDLLL